MGSIHNMFGSLNTGERAPKAGRSKGLGREGGGSGSLCVLLCACACCKLAPGVRRCCAATTSPHQPRRRCPLPACAVVVREAGGAAGAALSVEPAVVQGCEPAPTADAPVHPMAGEQWQCGRPGLMRLPLV